jgi:single-strand DNA-binding protein
MSNCTIEGKIIRMGEVQTFAKDFRKRSIVVETLEKYPQKIQVDFVKDRIANLDKYQVGSNVSISCDIRGSEFKDRFYVNLQAWTIKENGTSQPDAPAQSADGEEAPF